MSFGFTAAKLRETEEALAAMTERAERAERVAYYKRFKDAETEVARLRAVLAALPRWPGCASYRAQAEVERLRAALFIISVLADGVDGRRIAETALRDP